MPVLPTLLAIAGIANAARIPNSRNVHGESVARTTMDQVFTSSITDSAPNSHLGEAGLVTNITAGTTYWLNGGGTHNTYGNLNNFGNLYYSQTAYLKTSPIGGMTANYGKSTTTDGVLNNQGLIQVNDIGSGSAPTYNWLLRTLTNSGSMQFCGRGDTGGSTMVLRSDNDSYNTGLISLEQAYGKLGNVYYTALNTASNIYNNGAIRLINTVWQVQQNVYGTGCFQIGIGATLYLQDGAGNSHNPSRGPTFPNNTIAFTDGSSTLSTLHFDTQAYAVNPNFGPVIYGFGAGDIIEFFEYIYSFNFASTTNTLLITFATGNNIRLKFPTGYVASSFVKGRHTTAYGTFDYITYNQPTPSSAAPVGQCLITTPICQDLGQYPPSSGSSTSSAAASTTSATSTTSFTGPYTTITSGTATSPSTQAPSGTGTVGTVVVGSTAPFTGPYTTITSGTATSSVTQSPSGTGTIGTVVVGSKAPFTGPYTTVTSGTATTPVTQAPSGTGIVGTVVVGSSSSTRSSSTSSATYPAVTAPYLGCYTEATNGRALSDYPRLVDSQMTQERCQAYCSQFPSALFGVEYGTECYCGNSLQTGSVKTSESDCSFTCPGNASEFCGAGNRLNVFGVLPASSSTNSGATSTSSPSVSITPGASSSSSSASQLSSSSPVVTSAISSAASTTSSAATSTNTANFAYTPIGCYTDNSQGVRALDDFPTMYSDSMTIRQCNAYCVTFPAKYAGVEYGRECWCGNTLKGGSSQVAASDCSTPCPGDSSQFCGAGNRLSLSQLYVNDGSGSPSTLSSSSSSSSISKSSTVSSSSSSLAGSTTSVPSASSVITSSTISSSPSSTALACPASNGTTYTASSGASFLIECYNDHLGGDLATTYATSLQGCINNCDMTAGCVAYSYVASSNGGNAPCYLKSSVGADQINNGVWGGKLVAAATGSSSVTVSRTLSSASSSSTSPTRSSSSTASSSFSTISSSSASTATPSALACPASNGTTFTAPSGTTFLIECYNDHLGGDLSTTYATSLQGCIVNCDSTPGCVAYSYVATANGSNQPCYLKSSIGADQTNNGVWGGKAVAITSSSNVSATASRTSSMISPTSSGSGPTTATTCPAPTTVTTTSYVPTTVYVTRTA